MNHATIYRHVVVLAIIAARTVDVDIFYNLSYNRLGRFHLFDRTSIAVGFPPPTKLAFDPR